MAELFGFTIVYQQTFILECVKIFSIHIFPRTYTSIFLQLPNHMAVVQCIISCRATHLHNVHIKQHLECHLSDFVRGMIVGTLWAGFCVSITAVLLGFSFTPG